MSFIHMVLSYLEAVCLKHPYSPYTKYYFLLEPIALISSVERIRNSAIFQFVSFNVSIEKYYRHAATCLAFASIKPCPEFNFSVLNFYAHFFCEKSHEIRRVPLISVLCLIS